MRAIDYLVTRDDVDVRNIALVGSGAGALAAICAASLDDRVRAVAAFQVLSSFVTPHEFQGHRMATFVPFLMDIGDVPHLAALLAPRRLILARPVDAQSKPIDAEPAAAAFHFTESTYQWYNATSQLRIDPNFSEDLLADAMRGV
jgi:hypothetical protein